MLEELAERLRAIDEDATREINDLHYRHQAGQPIDFEELHDMFGDLLAVTSMLAAALRALAKEE